MLYFYWLTSWRKFTIKRNPTTLLRKGWEKLFRGSNVPRYTQYMVVCRTYLLTRCWHIVQCRKLGSHPHHLNRLTYNSWNMFIVGFSMHTCEKEARIAISVWWRGWPTTVETSPPLLKEEPLQFWKRNVPMLTKCFRVFLCVQSTSLASVSVLHGDIVSATRSCLKYDYVDHAFWSSDAPLC